MKYYIGGIVSDFQPFYNALRENIATRFNLENLLDKQRIPHITFKAPFERESIEDIKAFLEEFSQKHKPINISIGGVDYFDKDVIFFDIAPSEQIQSLESSLLRGLMLSSDISFEKLDNPDKHYHITLIKGEEMNSHFEELLKYLSSMKVSFETTLDNLTLFSKNGKKTEIEHRYPLR